MERKIKIVQRDLTAAKPINNEPTIDESIITEPVITELISTTTAPIIVPAQIFTDEIKPISHKYDEIVNILHDYLVIHNSLWHMLPCVHIYYEIVSGEIYSGYVREVINCAITTNIETVKYANIRKLWKCKDKNNSIEWLLCANSLAVKNRQIENLEARVARLESMLIAIVKQKLQ